jgi:hypothetical protein
MIAKIRKKIENFFNFNYCAREVSCKDLLTDKQNKKISLIGEISSILIFIISVVLFVFFTYHIVFFIYEEVPVTFSLIVYALSLLFSVYYYGSFCYGVTVSLISLPLILFFIIFAILFNMMKKITILKTKIIINGVEHDLIINGNIQEFYFVNNKPHREDKNPAIVKNSVREFNKLNFVGDYYYNGLLFLEDKSNRDIEDKYNIELKLIKEKYLLNNIKDF